MAKKEIQQSDSGSQAASKINDNFNELYPGSEGGAVQAGCSSLRVMTWNIGHFSAGHNSSSSITAAELQTKLGIYKKMLRDASPDIIGLQEYSQFVDAGGTADAATSIFDNYGYTADGITNNMVHNRVFSRFALANHSNVRYTEAFVPGAHYMMMEFELAGKTVKFINTHLDSSGAYTNGAYKDKRPEQIVQLGEAVADFDYVIITGDFNPGHKYADNRYVDRYGEYLMSDEFDFFNPYNLGMASHGMIGDVMTWPTEIYGEQATYPTLTYACDNILVRGFKISNVVAVTAPPFDELSDHAALFCDLTLI